MISLPLLPVGLWNPNCSAMLFPHGRSYSNVAVSPHSLSCLSSLHLFCHSHNSVLSAWKWLWYYGPQWWRSDSSYVLYKRLLLWLPIQTSLLLLPTLLILPTPLVVLGRQVVAGWIKKSPYFSTMLRCTALSTRQEASTWRKANSTKLVTWSSQKMLRNATTSGAMYVY